MIASNRVSLSRPLEITSYSSPNKHGALRQLVIIAIIGH